MKQTVSSLAAITAFALGAFGAFSASAATLIHDYEFVNTLADSLGGPALVPNGGTVSSDRYTFSANQGLALSSWTTTPTDSSNYTLDLSFKFNSPENFDYAKIVDFKGGLSDEGLYRNSGRLDFYGGSAGPVDSIPLDQYLRIVITRDGSGLVTGYINGVSQLSFSDGSNQAIFDATGNIINILQDDNAFRDVPLPGEINQFRIYSGAMTAPEVLALGGPKPVPEPSAALLGTVGLLGFCFRRSRK